MKKQIFIAMGLIVLFANLVSAEERITLTTYYPSPFGAYDRMRLVPRLQAGITCNAQNEGLIYYDSAEHAVMVCRDNGFGALSWTSGAGPWDKVGDDIFPTDTATNPNLAVGIGTADPTFKFHVTGGETLFTDPVYVGTKLGGPSLFQVNDTGNPTAYGALIYSIRTNPTGIANIFSKTSVNDVWSIYSTAQGAGVAVRAEILGTIGQPGGTPVTGLAGQFLGPVKIEPTIGGPAPILFEIIGPLGASAPLNNHKLFYNATKSALRVGRTTGAQWDDANIGLHSIAMGNDALASGSDSVAIGNVVSATGQTSFAVGQNITTAGPGSMALGSSIQTTFAATNSLGINLSNTGATLSQANTMAIMGGKVGINTVTPTARLQINDSLPNEAFGVYNAATGGAVFGVAQFDGDDLPWNGIHHTPYEPTYAVYVMSGDPASPYTANLNVLRNINVAAVGPEINLIDTQMYDAATNVHRIWRLGTRCEDSPVDCKFLIKIEGRGATPGYGDKLKLDKSGNLWIAGSVGKKQGGANTWDVSSDASLKKNIKTIDSALDKITQLRGVNFEWIEPEKHGNFTGPQMGMIAQEVEKIFPDWVSTDDGQKYIGFIGFEALAVEAVKELRGQMDEFKKQNEELKRKVELLEKLIQR